MSDGNGAPTPGGPRKDPTQQPPGPRMSRTLVSWLVLLGLAMLLVALLQNQLSPAETISIDKFKTLLQNQQVKLMVIKDDQTIDLALKEPVDGQSRFRVFYPPEMVNYEFIQGIPAGTEVRYERQSQYLMILLSMLPWLLIFAFIWFVLLRQIRGAGGAAGVLGNFGRSRHRVNAKEHVTVTFADVAGVEEAKEEVQEIVEFLKAPKKFQRLGARIPRGILLVGEPGCGKTLLAKAIAGEAEVPFFSISGSDFVEMFVGVGASRVRDLFKQAKDNAPCIIFLDEIDAVGRRRSAGFASGGHDEREQTLNAILVEMDGFDTNTQVIVIAATNRVDVLDPALIRPGRFDRQVYVSLPDLQGRYEILKVHARKVKLGPTVDLRRAARGTPMFSGADLAALINEAALIATMRNKEFVEQDDLEEARDKVRWGRAKKSRQADEKERTLTAYHEAGHALVQSLERDADPVHKVSIIPRGPYGGATFSLPEKDRLFYSRNYLLATIRTLFGGRIAEEEFFNEVSSGAAMDIRQVSEIARKMVREWGMGENVGFVYYGEEGNRTAFFDLGGRDYSEKTAESIDAEVRDMIQRCYNEARHVIRTNRDKLDAIAKALLKFETITGEEVNALIRGESISRAAVSDLLDGLDAGRPVGKARPVTHEPRPQEGLGGGAVPQPG